MEEPRYDAFLSHSHEDAEWVEMLAARLEDEFGFNIWLDKWRTIPGEPWQQAIARGLEEASSCVVIVGATTPSGWFSEEVQRALNRQASQPEFRVIPLLAPRGNPEQLPDFVELRTWVDFRDGADTDYASHALKQGIRGEEIGRYQRNDFTSGAEVTARSEVMRMLTEIREVADLLEPEVIVQLQMRTMTDYLGGTG